MTLPRRILLGIHCAALLMGSAAIAPAEAAPGGTRPPRTEIEWAIREIVRDIAEMAVYAKTGAAPTDGFAVEIVDSPIPSVLPLSVRLAAGGSPVVAPIQCPDSAAAPEPTST